MPRRPHPSARPATQDEGARPRASPRFARQAGCERAGGGIGELPYPAGPALGSRPPPTALPAAPRRGRASMARTSAIAGPSGFAKAYLLAYNCAQLAGWTYALSRTAVSVAHSGGGVYAAAGGAVRASSWVGGEEWGVGACGSGRLVCVRALGCRRCVRWAAGLAAAHRRGPPPTPATTRTRPLTAGLCQGAALLETAHVVLGENRGIWGGSATHSKASVL